MASAAGLGAGTVLPGDPSITRLNILKKFPGASIGQEATESAHAFDNQSGIFHTVAG